MNRSFLEELGLEKEVVDKVMAEHGKTVQDLKPAQEELEGLKNEKDTLEQELSKLQNTVTDQEKQLGSIDDLKKEVETYKLKDLKTSIAVQAGIPLDLATRLSGETEEEIKADAESLAGFVNQKQPLPLKQTEPDVNNENREMEQMLNELTGKQ